MVEEELARTPLPSPVRSNASASSSVAARQVPGSEGRRMMAFALGLVLDFGFDGGLVVAFEVGLGIGLVVWGCGRAGGRGRVGAEVDAVTLVVVVVVVVADVDRESVGCGILCRDGGGERRFRVVWGGAAIGEDEREITSGFTFAGAGLGATVALSDGGGLVAL